MARIEIRWALSASSTALAVTAMWADPATAMQQAAPPTETVQGVPQTDSAGGDAAAVPGGADPAAEPQAASPASQTTDDAPDIVVTAQRRSESLSRTPVAVSVIGADALQDRAIVSQSDLQTAVPGLQVKASQSENQLNFAIRGQSLDPFSSVRPGVLPYFNEVQIGGSGSFGLYDLQSVQVLKGPQGTLFGRNATGGAVLFTSARPGKDFGGYALARGGNYDLFQVEGAVNVPLAGERLLARVAGFYQRRDGFQRNLFDGERVGNVRRGGARGSLTFRPTDTIGNELVVDYFRARGSSTSSVLYSILQIGERPPGATIDPVPANLFFSPAVDAVFGPGAFARYLAANPGADPDGILAFAAKQKERGPYLIDVDGLNGYRADNIVVSNATTIDLGANTQIKNIFGFTDIRSKAQGEFDGSPYGIDSLGPDGRNVKLRQYSEELQLIGKTLGNDLSYVAGVYFSSERSRERSQSLLFDLSPAAPGVEQINSGVIRNRTLAGYAQGTYDLSDATGIVGLGVTAGARYTAERVRFSRNPDDVYLQNPDPSFVLTPFQRTFKKVSYQLGVQDQITSNLLLYAVHRRSFRSGGFNFFSPPIPGFGDEGGSEYRPEIATDVEIGAKFAGRIGGAPTRFSIAAYELRNKDIQRVTYALILGAPSAITVNVPRAKITGVEVDASIMPVRWLNLGGSVAYANGRFTRNLVSIAGSAPIAFGPFPDLPEYSGTVYAEAKAPIAGDLQASLRGDIYGQTKTFFSSSARALNPGARIPGYTLVNARAALENEQVGWSVSALVKNLFDKVYYVGGLPFESVFALNTAVPGEPRTFLVEARFDF